PARGAPAPGDGVDPDRERDPGPAALPRGPGQPRLPGRPFRGGPEVVRRRTHDEERAGPADREARPDGGVLHDVRGGALQGPEPLSPGPGRAGGRAGGRDRADGGAQGEVAEPVIHDGRGPARGAVSRAAGRRRAGAALGLVALLALAACATRREAPSADRPPPAPPDLTGQAVLVLPVQPTWGEVPAGLDAELEYW